MGDLKLFMLLVGCRLPGRHTEQHDVMFTLAASVRDTVADIKSFWPEAGALHIDAWREVTKVGDYVVSVVPRTQVFKADALPALFFMNLGGYRSGEFEEFHYKMLTVAASLEEAISQAKKTAFFRHTGFEKAVAHVDNKFGIDVDDAVEIHDILPANLTAKFKIVLDRDDLNISEDFIHLGYLPINKIK